MNILLRFFFAGLLLSSVSVAQDDRHASLRAEIARRPQPADWDAAVFLPYRIPNSGLDQLVGRKAKVVNDSPLVPDLTFTWKKSALAGDYGNGKAILHFTALAARFPVGIDLEVAGKLRYDALQRGENGRGDVRFAITAETVKPVAVAGAKQTPPPDWLVALTPGVLNTFLDDYFKFAIPVPVDFVIALKFGEKKARDPADKTLRYQPKSGDLSIETGKGGRINVRITADAGEIKRSATALTPIFVPSGVWLCVATGAPATPAAPADPPPSNIDVLLAPYQKQGGDLGRLLLRGSFLTGMFNELGAKTEAERRAEVKVIEHSGDLFKQEWRDNVLGKGGIKVSLENNDGKGNLTISPTATWNAADGLSLACGYDAWAQVDFHVHVDPLISGGIGTSVGCEGKSNGSVTAKARLKLTTNPNASVLSLVPEFGEKQCLNLTVQSDGKFKVGKILDISLDVGRVGAKVELPVPRDLLPAIPLLTTQPHLLNLPATVPLSAGTALITPPPDPKAPIQPGDKKEPCLTFIPLDSPLHDESGFVVAFDAKVEQLTKSEREARREAVADAVEETTRPKLEVGRISILLGGLEFGSGNEFIKIALAIIKEVDRAVEDAIKAGKNIERTVAKAGKDTEREVARAYRNTEREVGRAGKNVEREVGRAGKNVEREVGRFGKNVEHEVQRAVEPAKKATKWIKKTFGF